ncbi:hypothetical protein [Pedobacter jeongneungensis]|uniref:hypothetical protein n=1 Tax=Pedobacter jeongneungensis TaxID=947309 RepID=UPI00068C5280|nr:hypothetical protein [Pedobacter jeongneungensis]
MISEKDFWSWFDVNKNKYYFLESIEDDSVKENLLNEFLHKLHEYSEGLYFLIGGVPGTAKELIISAEGDKSYFPDVIKLTSTAPEIANWQIIAFKPSQGLDFVTSHNGVELNPRKMFFLPLVNDDHANDIAFENCCAEFQVSTEGRYTIYRIRSSGQCSRRKN